MARMTPPKDSTSYEAESSADPQRAAGRADLSVVVHTFPGRIPTGVCMIAAPVFAMVASALAIDIYDANGPAFITKIADHFVQFQIAINLQLVSMILLVFAVAGLAQAIVPRSPRLGKTGGVITLIGITGPLFFEGIYWGGSHLTAPSTRAAAAHLYDASQIPSIIMNVSGPALVVGFIVLAVGAARSRVLDRGSAFALGVTCILSTGFITGFIVISLVAYLGAAIALVPLGIRVLRTPAL